MRHNSDWERVGEVGVDAGLIWIGDPCYTVAKDSSHVFKNWKTFCNQLDAKEKASGDRSVTDFGGIGIAVSSGYGDGSYNVYVKRDRQGTILEAKVVFVEPNQEDETDE